jgi:hypothetical protein
MRSYHPDDIANRYCGKCHLSYGGTLLKIEIPAHITALGEKEKHG